MSERIQGKDPIFNVSTLKSVKAVVAKGATAPSNGTVIPAGYPLVAKGDGTYEVYTKAALAAQIAGTPGTTFPKNVAILGEPVTVASSMTAKVKVVFAGEVYLEGMREATEITTSDIADHVFINAHGHLVFTNLNDVQLWDVE